MMKIMRTKRLAWGIGVVALLLGFQHITTLAVWTQELLYSGYVDVGLDGLMLFNKDNLLTIDADHLVKASGGIHLIYKGKQYDALATDAPVKPVTSVGLPLVQFKGAFLHEKSSTLSNLVASVVGNSEKAKQIIEELSAIKTKSKYKEVNIDDDFTVFTTDGVEGGLIEVVRVGGVGNENWIPLCGSPWCQPSAQDKPLK